jgi:hypothetical protein
MRNLFGWLRQRVRYARARRAADAFFEQPYAQRVADIKRTFSQAAMQPSLESYLSESAATSRFRYPYFDVVLAYARELQAGTVMQLGCFGCQEAMFLADAGFEGRIVASDFDPERIEFLRRTLCSKKYSSIDFAVVDIENVTPQCFSGVDAVVCLAVMANIQPEGVERFFDSVARSDARLVIIGDIYCKDSLTIRACAASVRSATDRTWRHAYLALAARHGMRAAFVPNFSDNALRGIFVIDKGLPRATHERALGAAFASYFERQPSVLRHYDAQDR